MRIITSIVLHHTGISYQTVPRQGKSIAINHAAKWVTQLPRGMAYHYLFEGDGDVFKGRPEFSVGYHAGNWKVNLTSIGLACAGNYLIEQPSKKQLNILGVYLIDICTRYRIRWQDVKPHSEVRDEPTSCPGVDLKKLLIDTGILERERKRKLKIMNNALKRANVLRAWMLKRKIRFLETSFI